MPRFAPYPDRRTALVAGASSGIGAATAIELADATHGRLQDIDTATFDAQLQVHLVGANRLATEVLPGMLERQRGQLIFVGSDVSLRQRPHAGAYGAAKVALLAMVNNLQMELQGSGVTASIVHPGPTRTNAGLNLPVDSIESMLQDWVARGHARHTRSLRAQDVARAIAFVAGMPRGGYIASMLLVPEAPLADAPKMTDLK